MNNKAIANLDSIAQHLRDTLSAIDTARETTLHLSREVIRNCSEAIRSVHRQEYDAARYLLTSARSRLDEINTVIKDYNELLYTGFVQDAQKEFAEGSITLALISGQPLPTPQELEVSPAAYLNGMGEAVGELRRYLLDSLRRGEMEVCERTLSLMDEIYGVMVTMDFPDAITGGLRRTTDVTRSLLEKTRGDLTLSLRLKDLEQQLHDFQQHPR